MRWVMADGRAFDDCAMFFKVKEEFGELSNMAGGFPMDVCGVTVLSSEALYQAMRFPDQPGIQAEILAQASPMAAKMKAKKDRRRENLGRRDWSRVKLDVMRWCLRVKLAQNLDEILAVLMATGNRPIVERSRKDHFWGAVPDSDGILRGENWLGRLLVELREEVRDWLYRSDDDVPYPTVTPPKIANLKLLGVEISSSPLTTT